jgi:predicted nucleotidyltransferase
MSNKALQLPINEGELIDILRKHGVAQASIFGSYSRGDFTDKSDVDILVEFKNPSTSLFDQIDLQQELEKATNRRVDVITKIHPAFESYITPELVKLPL